MILSGMFGTVGGGGTSGGTVYSAWSPTGLPSGITLSDENTVATGDGSNLGVVIGDTAISGKRYFEFAFTPGSDNVGVGVAQTTTSSYLGALGTAYGHYLPSNDIYLAGSVAYNGTTNSTSPVVVGCAVDGLSLWVRVQGGSGWEGGGDPEAGTSPTLTMVSGTYYPGATPGSGAGAVTLNTGQASFVLWTPAGGFAGITA